MKYKEYQYNYTHYPFKRNIRNMNINIHIDIKNTMGNINKRREILQNLEHFFTINVKRK